MCVSPPIAMGVVLASSSPRRKRLLGKIARKFETKAPKIRETLLQGESFPSASIRLALEKAAAIARKEKNAVVIGADTIAYLGRKIYRKTDSKAAARRILLELSGRTHYVITGVCVLFPDGKCAKYAVKAAVRMRRLDGKLLDWYLGTGEWRARAGCYDISGKGARLVQSVRGEKETVAGLPLKRLRKVLGKG